MPLFRGCTVHRRTLILISISLTLTYSFIRRFTTSDTRRKVFLKKQQNNGMTCIDSVYNHFFINRSMLPKSIIMIIICGVGSQKETHRVSGITEKLTLYALY